MPRWEPDGVERLQAAALELFAEQGFEGTTVAEIARRAGLTPRSFFNHFSDKREVLFGLSAAFQQQVVGEIAACADAAAPLDAVVHALQIAVDATFEERRTTVVRRQRILDANPQLQEREHSKRAVLIDAMAEALQARGVDPESALLAAGAGMLVQQTATLRWMRPTEHRPLRELMADTLLTLRATVTGTPAPE